MMGRCFIEAGGRAMMKYGDKDSLPACVHLRPPDVQGREAA